MRQRRHGDASLDDDGDAVQWADMWLVAGCSGSSVHKFDLAPAHASPRPSPHALVRHRALIQRPTDMQDVRPCPRLVPAAPRPNGWVCGQLNLWANGPASR